MKHFAARFNLILFLSLLFGLGAANLLVSRSPQVSELEQRALASLPSFTWERLFKGRYTRDFDQYFSDRFAFRTTLVQVGSALQKRKGLPAAQQATIIEQGGDNTSGQGADSVKYLILGDRAYTLFAYSASAAEQYAAALNRFAAKAGAGVRVYSLLAPSSAAFIDADKYRALSDSQQDAFAQIDERLDSRIHSVDAYGALEAHAEEDIYFRTDHHWTALGAYYAYAELMKTMGEQPVALGKYETGTIPGFLGTAYKATLSNRLRARPDTIAYYLPYAKASYTAYSTAGQALVRQVVNPAYAKQGYGDYAVFLGGDYPWGEIETGNRNGRKLAVIKDSYANALIPFLLPHFETIDYLDPRSFQGNPLEWVKEHGITDVLFLNSSTVARSPGIAELLNKEMDR